MGRVGQMKGRVVGEAAREEWRDKAVQSLLVWALHKTGFYAE